MFSSLLSGLVAVATFNLLTGLLAAGFVFVGLLIGLAMNVKGFGFGKMLSWTVTLCLFVGLAIFLLSHDLKSVTLPLVGFVLGMLIGIVNTLDERPHRPRSAPLKLDVTPEATRPWDTLPEDAKQELRAPGELGVYDDKAEFRPAEQRSSMVSAA